MDSRDITTSSINEYCLKEGNCGDCFCNDDWKSPSDIIIGRTLLQPPFTAKYIKGETQRGIYEIATASIEKEDEAVSSFISDSKGEVKEIWDFILECKFEKLRSEFQNESDILLKAKQAALVESLSEEYEKVLRDLEKHLKCELGDLLERFRQEYLVTATLKINNRLEKEKKLLTIKKRNELKKLLFLYTDYYRLLVKRDKCHNLKLINKAILERRDAFRAFEKQMDNELAAGIMYTFSREQRKCNVQSYMLKKGYAKSTDVLKNLLNTKVNIHRELSETHTESLRVKQQWQDKICKILKLFLKLIGAALNKLPEQSEFLLEFERLLILQMNDIYKAPKSSKSILKNYNDSENLFKFIADDKKDTEKNDEYPFVIYGDLRKPVTIEFGSSETLASNIELPIIIVDREKVYAMCSKFEEIVNNVSKCNCGMKFNNCMCDSNKKINPGSKTISPTDSNIINNNKDIEMLPTEPDVEEDICQEKIFTIKEIQKLNYENLISDSPCTKSCYVRKCIDWFKIHPPADLTSYIEFNPRNYEHLKEIYDSQEIPDIISETIDESFIHPDLPTPFKQTNNINKKDIGVQCSIDYISTTNKCYCSENTLHANSLEEEPEIKERINALKDILHLHPSLVNIYIEGNTYIPNFKGI